MCGTKDEFIRVMKIQGFTHLSFPVLMTLFAHHKRYWNLHITILSGQDAESSYYTYLHFTALIL
jgi:hypothetical protein